MEENRERFAEDDPRHHTIRIRDMLSEVRDYLREDIGKINEPRTEALFKTTAETLDGLYYRLRRLRARARGGLAKRCLETFSESAFWKAAAIELESIFGGHLLRSTRSRQVGCLAGLSSKSV